MVRVLTLGLTVVAAVGAFMILTESETPLPRLVRRNEIYRQILDPEHMTTLRTRQNAEYQDLRRSAIQPQTTGGLLRRHAGHGGGAPPDKQIRGAFYVNWDAQSYFSLLANVDKLTMVFPEWGFIGAHGDSLVTDIDHRAMAVMQAHSLPIVPMISNFIGGRWDSASVQRMVASPARRGRFIADLVRWCEANAFRGVNIDFENLPDAVAAELAVFQEELYRSFHLRGWLVTQDVAPETRSYDLRRLQESNDYLILMAYDQHDPGSVPGPVADIRWVASTLESELAILPPEKVILGIPAYGYDWVTGGRGEDVTCQEAVVRAKEADEKISFDPVGANLHFSYQDDGDRSHEVWFADAATAFNAMRTAADYGTAGVALWRLGGEDTRLWSYFSRTVTLDSCREMPLDVHSLETAHPPSSIDFEGEGEILDVVATPDSGVIDIGYDTTAHLVTDERYVRFPSSYVIRKWGKADRTIVLTFDDGPSHDYTPAILDILKEEHVPAAFFILGVNAENNLGLLSRIYGEGHEIGNHSFSHPNLADVGRERTAIELNATRRIIESVTGHSTLLFRPPYNADSEPETREEILPVVEAREHNYYTIGESIDPQDWEKGVAADTIVARILAQRDQGNIILLHDAGGDRSATVRALPRIIHYFKEQGYRFSSVAALVGRERQETMPALSDRRDALLARINWWLAESIYWLERLLIGIFVVALALVIMRTIAVAVLAFMQKHRTSGRRADAPRSRSPVSVVVPAHNEEVTAVKTVRALLASTHPCLEVVFVDDGSTDLTAAMVRDAFAGHPAVRVLEKPNGGKASALNHGIAAAGGEILVCIDADTLLEQEAIDRLVAAFESPGIGAVAGRVKVGNERNLLTRWQAIEYITSQNFDRRAFDLLNCITVVPGAIGAFRKSAVLGAGGFTSDTLAEDCDLTLRLLRSGWVVRYCSEAVALTEAPETVGMFLKQRFRWTFGTLQSVWKHRDVVLDRHTGTLGLVALPNALLFQFLIPLIAPLADLMLLVSFLGGFLDETLWYYIGLTAVDMIAAGLALRMDRESLWRLVLLIPQRFVYRQLMYVVLFRSVLAALRGTLVGWGMLKRTGTVEASTS